ncbi:PAS domain S-box protein [Prosthecobacter sp.]|uniref:PAS domain S-box protein n=1 Tax=Prosthecobacter sp. TaxID=1965333 RepID=UPI002ABA4B50|nr:PAS domain S-box protein [Prosthecobacter sp.]MDZ4402456.1 PAS domain S-box protein [Prosthecobacter sp.]
MSCVSTGVRQVKQGSGTRHQILLALAPPMVALGMQWALWFWLKPLVFVLFYPAVFVSSWIGGWRGGLAGTALSVMLVWYFFEPPQLSFVIEEPRMLLGLGVFSGVGLLFAVLHEKLRAANEELVAAHESIQRSEARMSNIVSSAMDAIISVDSDQIIVLFNTAAESMFRCSAAEALNQPLDRFIPQRFREAHKKHVKGFGQTSHTSRSMRSLGTLSGVRANGDEFPIEASISHAEVAGQKTYTVILRDITERKEAEEALRASEEEFRASFYSAAVGKAQVDPHTGRYLRVNAKLCEITGYSEEELLRKTFVELTHPEDQANDKVAHERLTRGDVSGISLEKRYVGKDGRIVWVNVSTSLIRDEGGHPLRTLAVIQDITARREAEEALRESEARFTKVFRSNPGAICITTMQDGRFIEVNEHYCQLFDLTREELIGQTSVKLALWDDPATRTMLMKRLQAHELVRDYETRFRRKNGGLIDAVISMELIDFSDEQEPVVVSMFADITERKQAKAKISRLNAELEQRVIERTAQLEAVNVELSSSRAELQSLFESLPGLYLVLTPGFTIVAASDAYLKATLATREGILGRGLFEVLPDNPDDPAADGVSNLRASLERVLHNATADTMAIQKYDVRRPDGTFEEHYWSPVNSPLLDADGRVRHIIHRVEEVTEYVRYKQRPAQDDAALNARLQQMEAEVFQSSQKMQAANKLLEAANKELESFSYSVSHDLRAPLRAMDGFSRAVLEDYGPQLPEEGRRYLQIIRSNTQKMGELIDDLLTFSRLSRAPLNKQKIDPRMLVQSALDELGSQREGRQIDLRIESLPECEGDPTLLKQVWVNLLSNALKYSRKRETAVIEIGCRTEDGINAYFVRDNGAGFDMRYAHKLFGVFQRLHRAEDYEGTGVGLAIVQRVIHRHGGRVWAESVMDQGATFHFTLEEEPPS